MPSPGKIPACLACDHGILRFSPAAPRPSGGRQGPWVGYFFQDPSGKNGILYQNLSVFIGFIPYIVYSPTGQYIKQSPFFLYVHNVQPVCEQKAEGAVELKTGMLQKHNWGLPIQQINTNKLHPIRHLHL